MLAWAGFALAVGGCAGSGSTVLGPTPATSVSPVSSPQDTKAASASAGIAPVPQTRSLAAVHSWTLAAAVPAAEPEAMLASLAARPEDLLILDPAAVHPPVKAPASKSAPASPSNPLAVLQQNGQRRVVALLNISEITKANPSWQAAWVDNDGKPSAAAPRWLDAPVDKASGAFPIKYWDAEWQQKVTASLDQLLDAGYNGASLQGVGAFGRDLKGHATAGADMAALVNALAAHARKRDPNFSVLIDGDTALPAALTDVQRKDYLSSIDGVLAHDVFYSGDKAADNELAPDADIMAALDTFQKAGKAIFVTERLTDPDKIADFLARARSHGWLPDTAMAGVTPPAAPAVNAQVAANPR